MTTSFQGPPGRSSSQVSIYNYPEHLNPFYEDDNHKRLRFWKINRKPGRSSSFSFSGLKDIWTLKSFRLRKKSSTLGINKTSESPPPLRKSYNYENNNNADDFQRNTAYRSSLQCNMQTHSRGAELTFPRNSRYRSTIQTGKSTINDSGEKNRYTYGGSVTPTPRTKYITAGWTPSTSQTSLNSVNPFDEVNDDANSHRVGQQDNNNISLKNNVLKRPVRKKYRAPPPPVTVPKDENYLNQSLRIDENEQTAEIANLSNEIESFVRNVDVDENRVGEKENAVVEIKLEKTKENTTSLSIKETGHIPKIEYKEDVTTAVVTHDAESNKEKIEIPDDSVVIPKTVEDIEKTGNEKNVEVVLQTRREEQPNQNEVKKEINYIPTTVNELRIMEDDTPNTKTENVKPALPIRVHLRTETLKVVPISSPPTTVTTASPVISTANDLVNDEVHVTTGRRRSVKEIIDSINKSQSLLKLSTDGDARLNGTEIVNQTNSESNDSILRNIDELTESERQIKLLLTEMEMDTTLKIQENNIPVDNRNSYYDNIPDATITEAGMEGATDKIVFEKCKLRNKKNVDWNPLPKPRRSRNFEINNSFTTTSSSTTVTTTTD